MSKSDNAIMAKVRALYGKRLTAEDYGQLLQKRSVSEIAGFLKTTCYATVMQEVNEELVHREQLENLIHRRTLEIYLRLMKYSYEDPLFLTMYIMENEIKQLLLAMRLISAGEMSAFIVSLPVYLSRLMSFDLFALAGAKNYDDLLTVLQHCEYYPIVAKFRPTATVKTVNIPGCETALFTHYYKKLLGMIEKNYRGDTQKHLRRLLNAQIDIRNLGVIYRMKRYFYAGAQDIRPMLIPLRAKLSPQIYNQVLESDVARMFTILGNLPIVRRFPIDPYSGSQTAIFQVEHIVQHLAQKIFRFSTDPVVIVISYMALLDLEAANITNIIEGVRYNLPAEEIRSMLVI